MEKTGWGVWVWMWMCMGVCGVGYGFIKADETFFFALEFQLKHVLKGERPFICDVCGRSFASKSCLRRHKESHNGLYD